MIPCRPWRNLRGPNGAKRNPAHKLLCCPAGKTRQLQDKTCAPKYSPLQNFCFDAFSPHLIPVRGAYRDRHETWDGLRWTLVTSARKVSQGGKTVSDPPVAHTTDVTCVRQNRVVLTPGACASSLAVMWRSDRTRASVICKATGAIVHRSPGRARHKPSNHCAGKAGLSRLTCMPLCSFLTRRFSHSGPRVPAGTRSSLRPLTRRVTRQAKLGQELPRGCGVMRCFPKSTQVLSNSIRDRRCVGRDQTSSCVPDLARNHIGAIMPPYVVLRNQPDQHCGGRRNCSLALRLLSP